MSNNRMSSHLERSTLTSTIKNLPKQYYVFKNLKNDRFKNKGTQTDLRENDCQTLPWEPNYTIKPGHKPEVLAFTDVMSDFSIPVNMHEIDIINRVRMKRAWEEIFPPMDSPCNIRMCSQLISALEADKWSFREAEIEFVMKLRMNLADAIEQSKENECNNKTQTRLKILEDKLNERRINEIQNIRGTFSKKLRKLSEKRQKSKYEKNNLKSCNIFEGTLFGPRYKCSAVKNYPFDKQDPKMDFSTWINNSDPFRSNFQNASRPLKQICPRVRERNELKILKLRETVVTTEDEKPVLMKRKEKIVSLPTTPCCTSDTSVEDDQDLIIEKSIDCTFTEGRNRQRELIEELEIIETDDCQVKAPEETKIQEILEALKGKTISKMLTHLSNELIRLNDEKRKHAMNLVLQREEIKREIAKLSEEKLELNRRRELDRIFGTILKINEESVDEFLQDIIEERIESISEKEAEKRVIIEAACKNNQELENCGDAFISDMVYNVLLPEVKKTSSRKKSQDKQRSYSYAAHTSVYDEISNLPPSNYSYCTSGSLSLRNVEYTLSEYILSFIDIIQDEYKSEIHTILRKMLFDAKQRLYTSSD